MKCLVCGKPVPPGAEAVPGSEEHVGCHNFEQDQARMSCPLCRDTGRIGHRCPSCLANGDYCETCNSVGTLYEPCLCPAGARMYGTENGDEQC